MSKNFKQNDSRWAKLGYPSGNDNMANSGCGCVACADLVVLNPKYANYTPKQVRKYMVGQGFAIKGKGTLFAGIVPTLEHYGLKAKWPSTMTKLFEILDKGKYNCGILLMNSGTRGGVTWTTIAHFIAFTKYKKKNGKHYFYIEDPGWRNNDGWYTYEDNMKGLVGECYCAYVPDGDVEPTPEPSGKLTVDGVGGPSTVKRLQEFLDCPSDDGVISGQPISYKHLYPALKSVGFGSGGSQCIVALQKWLGLSGPDGVLGKNTTSALQKKLRSLGYLPANESIDGVIGPKTMKALQEMLNNNGKKKGGSPTPDPKPSKTTKVMDVSEFQDAINWSKAKADGIDGVIVRCGYRGASDGKLKEDDMFLKHIKGAYKAGLHVGIYMFTEAITEKEGREEAHFAIKMWKKAGVPISYPIAVDSEDVFYTENGKRKPGRANNISKAKRTLAIKGFCEKITERGFKPMIYASTDWLNNKLTMSKLPYDVWVAQYYSKCEYKGKYIIWQYTSTGKVAGAKGNIDLNKCYIEPKEVPYTPPTPKPTPTETIIDKEMKACKEQAEWMKNYKYEWESKPTVPKSKKKGTCVTYVACVLQRIGVLKPGEYIWQTGKGYGTGKVYGTNDKMTTTYMDNKTFTTCKDKLKKGDIVLVDDNKSGTPGSGGHIMIFAGKWSSDGEPYIYDNHSAERVKDGKKPIRTYGKSRKILAIVRLK